MYMMSFTLSKLCSLQFYAATSMLGEERKFQMSTCDWPSPQFHHDYPQTHHVNGQAVLLRMTWLNPFQILTCPLLMAIPLHNYTLHNLCSSNSVLNTQTVHLAVFFCMYHITQLGRPSKRVLFISVINQLDAQNFCFTISLFHASTCFEHMCSSSGGQNCIIQRLYNTILTSWWWAHVLETCRGMK